MWLLWIGAQGLLTASLVPGLAVRHGVVAFLGPAAITSVVPGPSDLPIRYQMLTSWGRSPGEATLSVAAGGIFSHRREARAPDHRCDRVADLRRPDQRHVAHRRGDLPARRARGGGALGGARLGEAHRAGRSADRAGLGTGAADVAQARAGRPHRPDGRRSCRRGADPARPMARGELGDDADRCHQVRVAADGVALRRRRTTTCCRGRRCSSCTRWCRD